MKRVVEGNGKNEAEAKYDKVEVRQELTLGGKMKERDARQRGNVNQGKNVKRSVSLPR